MKSDQQNKYKKDIKNDDKEPEKQTNKAPEKHEIGGRKGLEPTRYGDWEKAGRCIDF